jgi:hypothetical protein
MLLAELIDVAEKLAVPVGVGLGILMIIFTRSGRKDFLQGYSKGKQLREQHFGRAGNTAATTSTGTDAVLEGDVVQGQEDVLQSIRVVLKKSSWLRRSFEVITTKRTFQLVFDGRRTGNETFPIVVNGETQVLPVTRSQYGRRYQFKIDRLAGFIDIRISWWLTYRSVKVWIGDRLLYAEGAN